MNLFSVQVFELPSAECIAARESCREGKDDNDAVEAGKEFGSPPPDEDIDMVNL